MRSFIELSTGFTYYYFKAMGMMKNYLLRLLQQCSEEKFGQDAIEWAVVSGRVGLTYDLDRDVGEIMPKYDEIIEAYRLALAKEGRTLPQERAPMERAASSRQVKTAAAHSSGKKTRAA